LDKFLATNFDGGIADQQGVSWIVFSQAPSLAKQLPAWSLVNS
jgi:hypothetical protein